MKRNQLKKEKIDLYYVDVLRKEYFIRACCAEDEPVVTMSLAIFPIHLEKFIYPPSYSTVLYNAI
jgi:hypothetical protein